MTQHVRPFMNHRALGIPGALLLMGSLLAVGVGQMSHSQPAAALGTSIAESCAAVRTAIAAPVLGTGAGVDVALVDTGVVPVSSLPAARVSYGPDLSSDAANPALANLDAFGHGTNVASIISCVAPDARIVSVKAAAADGSTSLDRLVGGIDWVTANAHVGGRNVRVLNLSFNVAPGTDGGQLSRAMRGAWAAGIVVVVSAGNDIGTSGVQSPADDPKIVAVGASEVTTTGVIAAAATSAPFGRCPDVLAPGVGIIGARVPGSYLDVTFPAARVGQDGFRGSGTSQAAAVVSGTLAVLASHRSFLNPDQMKAILKAATTWMSGFSAGCPGAAGLQSSRTLTQSVPLAFWAALINAGLPPMTLSTPLLPGLITGASWNGSIWSGNRWSGNRWSGNRWSGSAWQ